MIKSALKPRWLCLLVVLLLSGCEASGTWGWYVIDPTTPAGQTNIRFLASGFWATIQLSVVAAVLSMLLGLVVALPALSTRRGLRLINRVYVEFIRAIPLLPLLFWVFYGLPVVLKSMGINVRIDAFWGAVITLVLSDSAFTAEIYRAGIQSV
ncbi:MAG: ABC transporter permease subunit, partial [Pseudomonadota bacterium]